MGSRFRGRLRPLSLAGGAAFALVLAASGQALAGPSGAASAGASASAASRGAIGSSLSGSSDPTVFGRHPRPLTGLPKDDARRGLIYRGLKVATKGLCVGGYQLATRGATLCTHGPDAPPLGMDVKADVKPDAARAAAASIGLPVCEGDGTTGRRVEVLYVHGSTSRYDTYLETFRTIAEGVDTIYDASAQETGGDRHVRFVTETVGGLCRPVVRDVAIADTALGDFTSTNNALRAQGFNRTDRKYLELTDANVFCGIGTFAGDSRKSDSNRSNSGPGYARVDSGCWSSSVASHELGHNFGAVNNSAPNSSKHGHCVDEYDVMCYKDSSTTVLTFPCSSRSHDQRLDCNHDDYYSTDPEPGTYLATNFNVADNLFLIQGDGTGSSPSPSTGTGT